MSETTELLGQKPQEIQDTRELPEAPETPNTLSPEEIQARLTELEVEDGFAIDKQRQIIEDTNIHNVEE